MSPNPRMHSDRVSQPQDEERRLWANASAAALSFIEEIVQSAHGVSAQNTHTDIPTHTHALWTLSVHSPSAAWALSVLLLATGSL
eukprot:1650748-Pyramimonas_sp.AAC.1